MQRRKAVISRGVNTSAALQQQATALDVAAARRLAQRRIATAHIRLVKALDVGAVVQRGARCRRVAAQRRLQKRVVAPLAAARLHRGSGQRATEETPRPSLRVQRAAQRRTQSAAPHAGRLCARAARALSQQRRPLTGKGGSVGVAKATP